MGSGLGKKYKTELISGLGVVLVPALKYLVDCLLGKVGRNTLEFDPDRDQGGKRINPFMD